MHNLVPTSLFVQHNPEDASVQRWCNFQFLASLPRMQNSDDKCDHSGGLKQAWWFPFLVKKSAGGSGLQFLLTIVI